MDQEGLSIVISADVRDAILNLTELTDATGELAVEGVGNLTAVNQSLQALRAAQANTGDVTELKTLNRAIQDLSSQSSSLKRLGTEGGSSMDTLGLSVTQARVAFTDLGRIITGQGFTLRSLASNFTLLGPAATIGVAAIYGLYEALDKQTDAEKRADQQAKQLASTLLNLKSAAEVGDEATGSEAGNIDRVQALAAAIQDTNLAYSERKTALNELRETNKAYFGDLTLEQSSLATLTKRVQDYSNALIAEALVKKQSDAIADLTSKYLDQERALAKLKTTRDQAATQEAIGKKNLPANIASEGQQAAALQQLSLQEATFKANQAFLDQRDAVEKLSSQIAEYKGSLEDAIREQLKYKPLKDIADPDKLKSVIPILEQIKKIQDEMATPSKEPLFKQTQLAQELGNPESDVYKLFQARIQEAFTDAITKGASDPELAAAYRTLGQTLQQQLSQLQNPDEKAHFAFQSADIDDKEVKQFHDDAGKQLTEYMKRQPAVKTDIQVDPNLVLQSTQAFLKATTEVNLLKTGLDELFADMTSKNPFSALEDSLTGMIKKLSETAIEAEILSSVMKVVGLSNSSNSFGSVFGKLLGLGNIFSGSSGGSSGATVGSVIGDIAAIIPFFLADGGVVTGPTLAMVGEAGPEVVSRSTG